MTAKTAGNKGGIDCTRGVSREQRAISRRKKLESSPVSSQSYVPSGNKRAWNRSLKRMIESHEADEALHNFEENLNAIAVQRFGESFCDREVSSVAYEERSFGKIVEPGEITCPTSCTDYHVDLSDLVASLALFDGDKMIFACSGVPILPGRSIQSLTRFVTSAHLVKQFNENRNKDDKLRVAVRLPDNTTTDGFLGLYDKDIAIVTCLGFLGVRPIDLDVQATCFGSLQAAGRAFNSGNLMTMHGSLYRHPRPRRIIEDSNSWVSNSRDISKAVLGGPLLDRENKILGINLDIYDPGDANLRCTFLSMELLWKRLKRFGILNPTKLDFRGYTLPKHVSSIVPSGFMRTICKLKAHGYPIPPPLVLEFNGRLLNTFEECFGELLPWKGYPYGQKPGGSGERVWKQLPKKVVTNVSRRVVSLASFNGHVRSFACTGLLIKWHGEQTVILTSASLVRSHDNEDTIDNSLTIEVFLPPNQHASGTLEFHNLEYNIAIVSLKKNFNAICPDYLLIESRPDDFFIESEENSSKKVVALGRDAKFGILMAASGELLRGNKGCKLDCKVVQVSTCKIKKAGIGGPLINIDGSFVGMNFYDGSGVTPFLPRLKIAEILRGVNYLPSECGYNHPMHIGGTEGIEKNRWPVPKAYWYHGAIDANVLALGQHIGRRLN